MYKWLAALLVVLPTMALAEDSVILAIESNGVNMRSDASFGASIVTRLRGKHTLRQLSQEQCWIKVQEMDGKEREGWIYGPAIGRLIVVRQEAPEASGSGLFDAFRRELEQLNRRIRRSTGSVFFTGAKDMGEGTVQLTASRSWLATPAAYRDQNLSTILSRWSAQSEGHPLRIQVVDNRGELRMDRALGIEETLAIAQTNDAI